MKLRFYAWILDLILFILFITFRFPLSSFGINVNFYFNNSGSTTFSTFSFSTGVFSWQMFAFNSTNEYFLVFLSLFEVLFFRILSTSSPLPADVKHLFSASFFSCCRNPLFGFIYINQNLLCFFSFWSWLGFGRGNIETFLANS